MKALLTSCDCNRLLLLRLPAVSTRCLPSILPNHRHDIFVQRSISTSSIASKSYISNLHLRLRQLGQKQQQFSSSAWWNPFGQTGIRDTNPQLSSMKTRSDNDMNHPRKIQERKDITLLLLATEYRKAATSEPKLSRDQLVDIAFEQLNALDVDSKTLLQLRHLLQAELEQQVIELFELFKKIDDEILYSMHGEDETKNDLYDQEMSPINKKEQLATEENLSINEYHEGLLRLELERTIDELTNTKPSKALKGANPKDFLNLKRNAIETLLNSQNRQQDLDQNTGFNKSSNDKQSQLQNDTDLSWVEADEFGYHESIDQEKNRLIRYYQTINICRSAKLRDDIGYSVIALQSSIPGAGRGVYVDGYAKAGSVLCFQPGVVWSKDNLLNVTVEEERQLERNDFYQMSLRADDYLIDSRQAPYTVLTEPNSNMMSLGHIVNHPTPINPPNARSAMLNFTQDMEFNGKTSKRYIPNTYAKPRNLTVMGSLWDRDGDIIDMHSMVLVATRDICNEEIFYDYRLATSHYPQWYTPWKDTSYLDPEEIEKEKQ